MQRFPKKTRENVAKRCKTLHGQLASTDGMQRLKRNETFSDEMQRSRAFENR
jgi:hypothetical protein